MLRVNRYTQGMDILGAEFFLEGVPGFEFVLWEEDPWVSPISRMQKTYAFLGRKKGLTFS